MAIRCLLQLLPHAADDPMVFRPVLDTPTSQRGVPEVSEAAGGENISVVLSGISFGLPFYGTADTNMFTDDCIFRRDDRKALLDHSEWEEMISVLTGCIGAGLVITLPANTCANHELRSESKPLGVPGLKPDDKARVHTENVLASRAAALAVHCHHNHMPYSMHDSIAQSRIVFFVYI